MLGALGLAGCTQDPVADWLGGFGDPVRGAAFTAPRNLGDTSRWRGNPVQAALAADQLEFLFEAFTTDPRYAPAASASTLHALRAGRAEMRGYLGIDPNADTLTVRQGLRGAAQALNAGSTVRAEAALNGAAFTAGPQETLRRLSDMPRLPRVADAAGAAARQVSQMDNRR
jgi:hypothetical protein